MARHLTVHVLTACLVVGIVFGQDMLRAEPRDSAQKFPQVDRSLSSDPFAPSPDIADLIRRNRPRSTGIKKTQHEQLTGNFGRIEGPPGWERDYDPNDRTTDFFPSNLSKELFVVVTVYPKLQIVDPNEAQTLPEQLHGKLVAAVMNGCRKGKGRTEGATQSEHWGPIVHSTFLCIYQDGKRDAVTLFTIKSTTQKQFVMFTSDESMHESQLPTVRAMLQPIVDGTAPMDDAHALSGEGADASPKDVLYAQKGSNPMEQLSTAPETVASVDLLRVLEESEIGQGLLASMQSTIVERQRSIAQLKQLIATRKELAMSAASDRKKAATIQQQIAADEGALLTAETELNAHFTKTIVDPLKAKARVVAAKLAQEFGFAGVVDIKPSLKALLSPRVTDLTDLAIANMTVVSSEKGAPIVRVAPERKPASPQAAPPQASTSMSQDELVRYLTEQQRIKHETLMSIIRKRTERDSQWVQQQKREDNLSDQRRRDDLRQDDLRRERERQDLAREQDRREVERQRQRIDDQRMEEQRRQQRLEDQRRDDQRRYDSYRR